MNRAPLGSVLVRNTVSNFAGQSVLMLLAFLAMPYIIGRFGSARYGVLTLLLTFANLLNLFQLGINVSLVKYLAAALGREHNQEEINRQVGTAFTLFLGIGATVTALALAASHWLVVHFFQVPPDLQRDAIIGFYLASLAFLLRLVAEAFSAVPIAAQRFDIVNYLSVGSECVRILGSVAVVYLGFLLNAVLAVILAASALFLAANMAAARRLVPGLSLRPRFSREHFVRVFHFSKFVAWTKINSQIGHSLDSIIIGYFLPVAYVAFYAVPYSLCHKIWIAVGNVSGVVFPAASALSGNSQDARLKELYLRGSKMVAAVAAFPAVALCILGGPVLRYWIGNEFADQGTIALALLSCGFVINCLMHIPHSVSQAMGHPEIPAKFTGLQTLSNFAFFLLLIPRVGIAGAAGGYLATQILLAPWFVHTTNRLLDVPRRDVLRRAYAPVLIPLSAAAFVMAVCRPWISSLFEVGAVGATGLLVYTALGAVVILDRKERSTCLTLLPEGASRFFSWSRSFPQGDLPATPAVRKEI